MEGARGSSWRASWRKWHFSRVSKDSIGVTGKKDCSREGERLGNGKECNGPGAFPVHSGKRMQTGCEGPLMAAGLGLECRI